MSAAATQRSFYVRFPLLERDRAALLAKATDYERQAGICVRDGKEAEAEHLRAQARAAWSKYLAGEEPTA